MPCTSLTYLRLAPALALASTISACGDRGAPDLAPPRIRPDVSLATLEDPIAPLPERIELDPRRVALGGRLFHDPILSGDGKVACVDCHHFDKGGADDVAFSQKEGRAPTVVNAPSIFNLAFDYRYNWTAKFSNLEDQLDGAMKNPTVMNSTVEAAVLRIAESPPRKRAFDDVYADGVTARNLRDAIATYERSLITPNSRFDRFRRGDAGALSDEEKKGYEIFKSHGCVSCHQGINVGGNLVQSFGVMRDYFENKTPTDADLGRYSVTKKPEDKFVFRVPSLRNVASTAPYFHDGSAATLDIAVTQMAEYQLGESLEPGEINLIVAFLKTLTGETPKEAP